MSNHWNDLLAGAVDIVRRSGQRAIENLEYANADGTLELRVFFEDDGVYGEFFDISVSPCWDGCNNITRVHRAGWCKVNPEHADFDCMCGISLEDEDEFYAYLDEQAAKDREAEPMFEVVGSFVFDPEEEPF